MDTKQLNKVQMKCYCPYFGLVIRIYKITNHAWLKLNNNDDAHEWGDW